MIFHIDADSFYAACEQIFRPDLREKPIAVLSNNDGVTISLNRQCKSLGFHRGDPYFKMKYDYKTKGVFVFSSNYTLYADISRRVNLLYDSFCAEVEQYSIDESFLLFPDWADENYTELAESIRSAVRQQIHIPVSVGIAPTKTLAKLCNKRAKLYGGICDWNKIDHTDILRTCPASDIWGIGKSKEALLARNGVKTALDLKNFPLARAKKYLTITGYKTVRELNETPSLAMADISCRKNITVSRSSARGMTDIREIETALSEYTQLAVERMRNENSACRTVSVSVMTARPYDTSDSTKTYRNSAAAVLSVPTSYLPDILGAAIKLLHSVYRSGFSYRKIMINLLMLEPDGIDQQELFATDTDLYREKTAAVMKACDQICRKYGRGTLHTGIRNQVKDVQKDGSAAAWMMNRSFLSPEYTTRLADLPEVS
jgi:DNA polymerase V